MSGGQGQGTAAEGFVGSFLAPPSRGAQPQPRASVAALAPEPAQQVQRRTWGSRIPNSPFSSASAPEVAAPPFGGPPRGGPHALVSGGISAGGVAFARHQSAPSPPGDVANMGGPWTPPTSRRASFASSACGFSETGGGAVPGAAPHAERPTWAEEKCRRQTAQLEHTLQVETLQLYGFKINP